MVYSKIKSQSYDTANKSSLPARDSMAVSAPTAGVATISPMPTRPTIAKATRSQLLTPVPGRLTPVGQGRIKAPPVCMAPALKQAASNDHDFKTAGVCFTPDEAESCAEKAVMSMGGEFSGNADNVPLNVEKYLPGASGFGDYAEWLAAAASSSWLSEGKALMSSNSSIVTASSSSSSCGRSAPENEVASKEKLPVEVVRTDLDVIVKEEKPRGGAALTDDASGQAEKTNAATNAKEPRTPMPSRVSSTALSTSFTDSLVKGNTSRQGRSLQRWLVNSSTNDLVRQVAGTIPITRDGRIILASASRKTEWILPKGGWDEDETKEECAARETFEEAGLLGSLGGCLEPIDYETGKSKKRRLSQIGNGAKEQNGMENVQKSEEFDGLPLPKRIKYGESASTSPTSPESASSSRPSEPTPQTTPSAAAATQLDPSKYTFVRLLLFPLYVTTVKSDWPEKGRLRKIVTIDEAINIMEAENRLYFKKGLEMIKERGLHQLNPDGPK